MEMNDNTDNNSNALIQLEKLEKQSGVLFLAQQ